MQSHNKMMAWSCFFIVSAVLVFVRAKIGEKCQAHNYLACNLVAILLGQGTKKVGTERKIVCRRLENHSPEIEKSFGAEKNNALQRLSYLLQGVAYYTVCQLFIHLKPKYSTRLGFVNHSTGHPSPYMTGSGYQAFVFR